MGFQNKAFFHTINGLGSRELSTYKLFARNKKNMDAKPPAAELYKPRTDNQALYVKYLTDISTPIVVGVGPAGSGKTLFACNQAVAALRAGFVQKIILTRPIVPVEEDIGFLPGSLINKMDPWTRPIFDILLEFYPQKDIDSMLHNGVLEISPLAYMRGRTFKRAFVIADEMQNSSPNQMLMLTTRIGEQSKLVITGDLVQSDRGSVNGLADFIGKIRAYEKMYPVDLAALKRNRELKHKDPLGIRIVEMENQDIQRSPIVAKLLKIYSSSRGTTVPPTTPSLPGVAIGQRGGQGVGQGVGQRGGQGVGQGVGQDSDDLDDVLGNGVSNSTTKDVFWKSIYCSVEDTILKNVGTNTTSIQNTTNATVNISLNNIPGVSTRTVENHKSIRDSDAALMPLRSNITKSNYYPWEPMDI
uniref:PhoH-like protein domain-containing protein n=1 Tax=viral metagenome TaxID=1070528 RepID=A0A6C0LQH6_9ZZZZ